MPSPKTTSPRADGGVHKDGLRSILVLVSSPHLAKKSGVTSLFFYLKFFTMKNFKHTEE